MVTYLQCPWQPYSFHSWSPEKGQSCQSVRQNVNNKKILFWIRTCHPSSGSSNQEAWGNGDSHGAYLSSCESFAFLPFDVFKGILVFINLPSHYSFRRIDVKPGIGTVIRVLYNISNPAVTVVSHPIRIGEFSKSHVPIPDRRVCEAGRFTPIHTSLEAVRSSPCGPHQSGGKTRSASTALCTCCVAPKIKTCRSIDTTWYRDQKIAYFS
jgi:hypothetical protein